MTTTFRGPNDTWVLVDGESARLGLRSSPGDCHSVNLPALGVALRRAQVAVTIAGGAGRREVMSPVSGTVVLVNEALRDDPSLVSSDPLGRGWLVEVQLSYDETLEGLVAESTG